MKKIIVKPGMEINLGKRGENMAHYAVFDISGWEKTYGEGSVQLLHQRNGDKAPYICVIEVSGGKARWHITDLDVSIAGRGKAELQYFVGEIRVKSETWVTNTERALNNAGPVPGETEKDWLDTMMELGNQTTQNAEAAADSAREAADSAQAADDSAVLADRYKASAALYVEDANKAANAAEEARDGAISAQGAAATSAQSAAAEAKRAEKARDDAELFASAASRHVATAELEAGYAAESAGAAKNSEEIAVAAKEAAEKAVGKNPYIGADGNWYVWDAEKDAFVDTDLPARGPQGDRGYPGAKGDKGDPAYPDWNQNDENSVGYIKNRPFYTDIPVILSEQTVVTAWSEGDGYNCAIRRDDSIGKFALEVGESYEVIVDGNSYFFVGQDGGGGDVRLGNPGGTVCLLYSPDTETILLMTDNPGEHTIEIRGTDGPIVVEERYRNLFSGSGGASVQSDWNQNDEDADSYIKNRPFYGTVSETVVEETVIETELLYEDNPDDTTSFAAIHTGFVPEFGEVYTVVFDGKEYTCKAYYLLDDIGRPEFIALGNKHLASTDTMYGGTEGDGDVPGAPFGYQVWIGGEILSCVYTAEPGKYTLEIARGDNELYLSTMFRKSVEMALPSIQMDVAFTDGTSKTYKLYGKAVG